jgi:HEAT repeat protein
MVLLAATAAFGQQPPPPPQPEPVLLEIVRSDAPPARKAEAFRQLGQVGTARSVPVLAGLLADEKVAHWARIALEQIPDPSVPEALKAALPNLKGRLLAGALISLGARPSGARGENADAAILARYLRDADPEVAAAAANALGRQGTPAAARAIEQAIPTAPDALKPELWDATLRAAATLAAGQQREEAARIYDRLRASGAPAHVRLAAARGAVLARRAAGIPLLTGMLQDADRGTFNIALELAQVVPGTEATRAVAGQLPKLPAPRRALVVQALGNRGDRAALPAIRAAAREGDPAVRIAAIKALVQLQDAASMPLLLDAAVLKDEAIASAAAAAIVSLPGAPVEQALIREVGGADQARSLAAIEALSRRQARTARPVLLKAAGEGAPPVRLAALKALGDLATDADVDALLGLLTRARSEPEIEAAEGALTAVTARTADAAGSGRRLAGALGAAPPPQKMALLRVLAAAGGPAALQAVRSSLKDPNPEVRETALGALVNWPSADAAPDLLALARGAENPTHKILALRGYIRLAADDSLPAERRLAMCADARSLITRDEERRLWLGALGAIPSPAALPLIAPLIGTTVNDEASSAAVSVARRLLTGAAASSSEVKAQLPAIGDALQKAAQHTKDERLGTEIRSLQARVRELQR